MSSRYKEVDPSFVGMEDPKVTGAMIAGRRKAYFTDSCTTEQQAPRFRNNPDGSQPLAASYEDALRTADKVNITEHDQFWYSYLEKPWTQPEVFEPKAIQDAGGNEINVNPYKLFESMNRIRYAADEEVPMEERIKASGILRQIQVAAGFEGMGIVDGSGNIKKFREFHKR